MGRVGARRLSRSFHSAVATYEVEPVLAQLVCPAFGIDAERCLVGAVQLMPFERHAPLPPVTPGQDQAFIEYLLITECIQVVSRAFALPAGCCGDAPVGLDRFCIDPAAPGGFGTVAGREYVHARLCNHAAAGSGGAAAALGIGWLACRAVFNGRGKFVVLSLRQGNWRACPGETLGLAALRGQDCGYQGWQQEGAEPRVEEIRHVRRSESVAALLADIGLLQHHLGAALAAVSDGRDAIDHLGLHVEGQTWRVVGDET